MQSKNAEKLKLIASDLVTIAEKVEAISEQRIGQSGDLAQIVYQRVTDHIPVIAAEIPSLANNVTSLAELVALNSPVKGDKSR